jgi:DNA-binding Xre family transcriptional regulator
MISTDQTKGDAMTDPKLIIDSKKLRVALANADLDQNKAAEKAGISFTTLSRLKDTDKWQPKTLAALALALNCNPIDLLNVDEFPAPKDGSPANGRNSQ